eukprot:CAMPEP_0197581474 /NCGR_PEP_ID=MMETSP1326-20131121/4979_1 /TAXON_ID=1155430 /ORGANISM="Genus nov. species nov., Strain RCC2288" /LENGTH=69 /DNA_ID=CAMNT_0043145387 /DNA_START=1 /DNA_END=207 /DNA_ORIENTATION=+
MVWSFSNAPAAAGSGAFELSHMIPLFTRSSFKAAAAPAVAAPLLYLYGMFSPHSVAPLFPKGIGGGGAP